MTPRLWIRSGSSRRSPGSAEERSARRTGARAAAGAAMLLAAGLLSACTIEMLTPTPAPTISPTFTPELPLSSLLPTLEELPTESPTAAPTPTPDALRPEEADQRIFFDPLDTAISGWNLPKNNYGTASFSGGMLVFAVNSAYVTLTSELPRDLPADLYIEATVQTLLCGDGLDTFGIVFRSSKPYSYRYVISCHGQLRFERFNNLTMDGWSAWRETLGLLQGAPATNRIGVLIRGQTFRFYVGGIEVFSGHDPMSISGGLGLFVRTEKGKVLSVGFEEISVYTLKESA
jgi:hypothetical protein